MEVDMFLLCVLLAAMEEGMDDPVSKGVEAELVDTEEVLPGEPALVLGVEVLEPAVETSDLLRGEAGLLLATLQCQARN